MRIPFCFTKFLLALNNELGNTVYRVYIGIILPYSLSTEASKTILNPKSFQMS